MSEQRTPPADPASHVVQLEQALGAEWPNIAAAHSRAGEVIEQLRPKVLPHVHPETTLVVFGSLARLEFTEGSDIDWTLLVDGAADPDHWNYAERIRGKLESSGLRAPSAAGSFGSLTFSHDLIHKIGGEDDTNQNTTQRLLLLLESAPIGRAEAYERVIANILARYIEEEVMGPNDTPFRVPRFLLNDFARYWRTMAVDFAHKRRVRQADKWAIRTTKLRLSRKLLHTAGLLTCFLCGEEFRGVVPTNRYYDTPKVTRYLAQLVGTTPLDIVARVVLNYFGKDSASGRELFGAYDAFLGLLNDPDKRRRLEGLSPGEADSDPVYQEARGLGLRFQDALTAMFFDGALRDFTIRYGVF